MDSKLHRIYALAQHGMLGEREAARGMLDRELSKLGMTLEQFEEHLNAEQKFSVHFHYKTEPERRLILHVISAVLRKAATDYRVNKDGRVKPFIAYDLTESEQIRVNVLLEHYREPLEVAMNDAISAFMIKHALLAPASDDLKPTAEELRRRNRLARMAKGMNDVPPVDRLLPSAD